MVFSSLIFIFGFLPLVLLGYYLSPQRYRNGYLLAASCLFYLWGAPRFFPILLGAAVVDYWISRAIHGSENESRRKRLLILGLTFNLSLLAYFKYSNFFVEELNHLFVAWGLSAMPWTTVILPIGISFITFEEISYLVDIYRRVTPPAPNFPTYALFLCLFPHLIAGPIFRYHDVSEQLVNREHSTKLFYEGLIRFCNGLGKKVLIADPVARVADTLFAVQTVNLSPGLAWLAVLAYSIQIYFDFSGYSDMAIGLGKMFGFRFVENFDRPYSATSITDFWRRWHISLSNWMREYLYIPLGGNRFGPVRTYINLWVVFLLSGFWHGANWTFLFWGFYHGLFLVLDRLFLLRLLEPVPAFFRRLLTFLIVILGWVPFRTESLGHALEIWKVMFGLTGSKSDLLLVEVASGRALCALAVGLVLGLLPFTVRFTRESFNRPLPVFAAGSCAVAVLFFSTLSLVNSDFHPFIYFRF